MACRPEGSVRGAVHEYRGAYGRAGRRGLFIDDVARRGQSPARAAAGVLLARISDSSGFATLLLAGLVYLYLRRDLMPYQIAGAAVLVAGTVVLCGLLLLGVYQPDGLRRVLQHVQGHVNRIAARLKPPIALPAGWAERHTDEFREAGLAIMRRPRSLIRTLGTGLAIHIIDLSSLLALFLAFNQPVRFGTVVAGYAIGILFWKMSPVPEGIGVVEGVMVLVYRSLGVRAARATLIALAFRGLTYWIPMTLGFLMLRRLRLFRVERTANPETVAQERLLTAAHTLRVKNGE